MSSESTEFMTIDEIDKEVEFYMGLDTCLPLKSHLTRYMETDCGHDMQNHVCVRCGQHFDVIDVNINCPNRPLRPPLEIGEDQY